MAQSDRWMLHGFLDLGVSDAFNLGDHTGTELFVHDLTLSTTCGSRTPVGRTRSVLVRRDC